MIPVLTRSSITAITATPLSSENERRTTGGETTDLVKDRQELARYVEEVLAECHFSYQEQERHTGVSASTVYAMAHGGRCSDSAIQQFAAFAAYHTKRHEAQKYWRLLLDQLIADGSRLLAQDSVRREAPSDLPPAEEILPIIHLLAQKLMGRQGSTLTGRGHSRQSA